MRREVKNREIAIYQVGNRITASWKRALLWNLKEDEGIKTYLCVHDTILFEVSRSDDMEQYIRPIDWTDVEPVPIEHLLVFYDGEFYIRDIWRRPEVRYDKVKDALTYTDYLMKLDVRKKASVSGISAAP